MTALATITVELSFDAGTTWDGVVALQIQPRIIMRGQASDLTPGVVALASGFVSIAEIVAYGINDGNAVADAIEADDDMPEVYWRVRESDIPTLRRFGVID